MIDFTEMCILCKLIPVKCVKESFLYISQWWTCNVFFSFFNLTYMKWWNFRIFLYKTRTRNILSFTMLWLNSFQIFEVWFLIRFSMKNYFSMNIINNVSKHRYIGNKMLESQCWNQNVEIRMLSYLNDTLMSGWLNISSSADKCHTGEFRIKVLNDSNDIKWNICLISNELHCVILVSWDLSVWHFFAHISIKVGIPYFVFAANICGNMYVFWMEIHRKSRRVTLIGGKWAKNVDNTCKMYLFLATSNFILISLKF